MTITDHDIARWRLRSQHAIGPFIDGAETVVDSLLAVQAENPAQSAWAVVSRTSAPDLGELAELLGSGQVLRTHVLRPTWHYVRADDAAWLLELTAPRVRRVTAQGLREVFGMGAPSVDTASELVLAAVADGRHRTRPELADELSQHGFELSGQQLMILLAHLELDLLVCSGIPRDGEHTYARFDERVPSPRRPDRDDALGEIARRYFSGHGPATERDLAYWATLTLGDVRRGLESARDHLDSFQHDGRTFWHAPGDPPDGPGQPGAHLLQILDELYRGYQDSRMVLDVAGLLQRGREPTAGMALVDAQIVATMRRRLTSDRVIFSLGPYRDLRRRELDELRRAAARYGDVLGLEGVLEVS
ncbi:winged helix DNA-binding domain-containing protein [Agromyces sp. SYSU K20354]|uniref:winged helix DNA-binding domain-containing protein n=1 Tax=Agromyces cavernae TaxID=2898659 RepID=UPI001E5FD02B|nr:winged helix DNA-binding domain-containing protein [Agromyces cavernae]MCD2443736.1 winged helix DNA-binding domain-containing protein [Agromyces cavernae]